MPITPYANDRLANAYSTGIGNPNSHHSMGRKAAKLIAGARETFAGRMGGKPEEYYFTSGGTASNFIVHKLFPHHLVLSSSVEHKSNTVRTPGGRREFSVNENGEVITSRLFDCLDQLDEEDVMVSLIWVNNETGAINPIPDIGRYCKDKPNVIFHVDATQAVGHIPVDIEQCHIDAMSFSAHKFGGPQGVGCLYLSDRLLDVPMDEDMFHFLKDAKTLPAAGIDAMRSAFWKATENVIPNMYDVASKMQYFLTMLRLYEVDFRMNGTEERYAGISSLTFPGLNAETLMMKLDLHGTYVSTGAACSSEDNYSLHVLQEMGLSEEDARCTIRVSIGPDVTYADMKKAAEDIRFATELLKRDLEE